MTTSTKTASSDLVTRWALILGFAALAFLASYGFAIARSSATTAPIAGIPLATTAGSPAAATPGGAGGCCGSGGAAKASPGAVGGSTSASPAGGGGCCGGASGPKITKKADVVGGVQTIAVDLSKGYYDPSTIELKAGLPAEITFSQAAGCLGQVQSQELSFFEDLTSGPKTVKLGALQPGTYTFTCGMQMVSGTIVVK
jgi:plastocyanin